MVIITPFKTKEKTLLWLLGSMRAAKIVCFMCLCVGAHLLLHIQYIVEQIADPFSLFSTCFFPTLLTAYTCFIRAKDQSKNQSNLFTVHFRWAERISWSESVKSSGHRCPDRMYLHQDISLHCHSAEKQRRISKIKRLTLVMYFAQNKNCGFCLLSC